MTLALNKSTLKVQRDELQTYRKFLPSLDLKRQQLLAAVKVARVQWDIAQTEAEQLEVQVAEVYPLLGSSTVGTRNLASLISVSAVHIEEENLVGTKLPRLKSIDFEIAEYSRMVTPFWVDQLIASLRQLAEHRIHTQVLAERLQLLEAATRRVTQRVNLFEQVLIPQAEANIRKIVIFLSDQERAAVVRSKIAKQKNKAKRGP
jgi:V/A-type H+-transporting ATPase subunit D